MDILYGELAIDNPDLLKTWSADNINHYIRPLAVMENGAWVWEGYYRYPGNNFVSYWNNEYDALIETVLEEKENIVKKNYFNTLQEMLVDDGALIWLFSKNT